MSQSIQELKDIYALFAKGDIATLIADRFTEDVDYACNAADHLSFNGKYSGKEQVQKYFDAIATEFQFTEWDCTKFKYFDCGKVDGFHVVHTLGDAKVLLLKNNNKPATGTLSHTFYLNDQWQIAKGIEVVSFNVDK